MASTDEAVYMDSKLTVEVINTYITSKKEEIVRRTTPVLEYDSCEAYLFKYTLHVPSFLSVSIYPS